MLKVKIEPFTPVPSNLDPNPETTIQTWVEIPGTGVWVMAFAEPYRPPLEFELPDAG